MSILGIITLAILGILFVIGYLLRSYLEQIALEKFDEWFRPHLEKWGIVKPRIEPTIIKQIIILKGKNEVEFKDEIKVIDLKPENYMIQEVNGEFTTTNKKIKFSTLNKKILTFIQLAFTNFVYPSVYILLENNDIKTSFQIYFAYKKALKDNNQEVIEFIEKGLNFSGKNKEIKEWFEVFKRLDMGGDFISIVLPISKEIKNFDENTKKEFTLFIKNISKEDKFVQPFKIGNIKMGIIRIGTIEKHRIVYYNYLSKLKKEEKVDLIVLCGRGRWINLCKELGDWAKTLFNMGEGYIETKFYSNTDDFINNKNGINVLRIHLKSKEY